MNYTDAVAFMESFFYNAQSLERERKRMEEALRVLKDVDSIIKEMDDLKRELEKNRRHLLALTREDSPLFQSFTDKTNENDPIPPDAPLCKGPDSPM